MAQGSAQQIGLPCHDRAVEVEVHMFWRLRRIVHAQAQRQRQILHEGAASCLAAHQPHGLQFCIDARGSHQRQAVAGRELAVRGQSGACRQTVREDFLREVIHQWFVACVCHCSTCLMRPMYP
ncbi:hypothetical protein SDC9_87887 [bioreactor metagenome]|uniref:Uncharacterized protein n=1 Tax=bioreactor metagenome TaxID=1076179 RepID=A0A644ZKI0_9ZZZZ